MDILLRRATIIGCDHYPSSQPFDILIKSGIIEAIGQNLEADNVNEITSKSLNVSSGWTDGFADFADPGFEQRETLETGAKAAAAGGFTKVFICPETKPALSNANAVSQIRTKSYDLPVDLLPIAAITQDLGGKALTEMYELIASGAVAFSDGVSAVQDEGLLTKALQYLSQTGKPVIQFPEVRSLAKGGQMNEGLQSTRLGLAGKPVVAEHMLIRRDIELARYSGGKIHFAGITTAHSAELVAEAKSNGIQVSCSVTPDHLLLHDGLLEDYDCNFKHTIPLRSQNDMLALQEAVKAGLIDTIESHHIPQHSDDKDCEFEYAKPGTIGLQTVFSSLNTLLGVERFVSMVTANPQRIFGLSQPGIAIGQAANITVFDPDELYTFDSMVNHSKSRNSPWLNTTFQGKVIGIYHKNRWTPNEIQ